MVGSIAWGGCDPAVTSPGGECISGSHSQSVVFHRRRVPGFQWVYTSLCPSRVFDKSSCGDNYHVSVARAPVLSCLWGGVERHAVRYLIRHLYDRRHLL